MCPIGKRRENRGGVKCALCVRRDVRCFCESRAFSGDIQKRWTDANRKDDDAGQISIRNNQSSVPRFLLYFPNLCTRETAASISSSSSFVFDILELSIARRVEILAWVKEMPGGVILHEKDTGSLVTYFFSAITVFRRSFVRGRGFESALS